VKTKPRD